jgi:large subunit ribosomal protein L24
MLSGEIDIGVIGATHVTNAVTSGGDMTMLLGLETKLDYFLVARPSIKRAEELKGKKVAIGTPSGTASLGAYVGLDYLGLVPRRDNITLLGVGAPADRLAALFAGGVDAISVSPDVAKVAMGQGYTLLLDLAKENVPFQSSGLVTSRRFMRANPQFVENVARAIVEGVNFVRKHTKANPQKNIKGGILEREAPVHASNLMLVCGECGKPSRIGHKVLDDGKKVRVCRRCGGIVDK